MDEKPTGTAEINPFAVRGLNFSSTPFKLQPIHHNVDILIGQLGWEYGTGS